MDERSIFEQALDLTDPSQRSVFLDEACGQDRTLRERIEALLRSHEQADSFLQSPAAVSEATFISPVTERPGDTIGPYKLLQQIGEGGMGTVFMAEQIEPVERRVALKIIKPGMDSQQVIARFEAERQALAMMDHPNIAKVLDAGTTDSGRPYFVMELVKGMFVTQYCDEQHLTPRERLELFVPICQAVQHAHQKGIIHRDLKPSNILIARYDDKPVPKIIDFGVAKATSQRLTEKTMFTQYGQIVGTMEYMAPEQANFNQLDVDTRSDIYSLGVLLYELLTGETPFDKKRLRSAAFDELLRIIREEDPPRPSTRLSSSQSLANTAVNRRTEPKKLSLLIRGELDWIVMKALEKDRARRYETASKFAEDISHYLNNEAVLACPPAAAYRFRKFAQRNKAVIGTTAAIGLVLIAGIIGTTWQAIEADKERDRALDAESLAEERLSVVESQKTVIETEKQNAVEEAQRATKAEELAEERLEQVEAEKEKVEQEKQIAQAVQDFLQNKLLGQADVTAQADALRQLGDQTFETQPNPTIRELLDRAAAELSAEKIEENFPGQPLLQAELLYTMGSTYRGVGEYKGAIEFLTRARELYERALGPDNLSTLASMNNLALAYQDAGQLDLAVSLSEETLKLKTEKLGPDHLDTLTSMNNLALAYKIAGQLNLALPLYEETLKLMKKKLGQDHPHTLSSMNNLAMAYQMAGQLKLALPLLEETLKLKKETFGPDHPETLRSMDSLAMAYKDSDQMELALPLSEETLKLRKEKLGPDHPDTLTSMNNLAGIYRKAGKLDLAVPLSEETLKLMKKTLGPDHPDTLTSMKNLAQTYWKVDKLDLALPLFEEAFKLRKETLGPDHPYTLNSMGWLALAYKEAGQLDLALPLLEEELKLRKEKLGPDHPDTLNSMGWLAQAYIEAGQLDLALPLYEETLKLCKEKLGMDHPQTRTLMTVFSSALALQGLKLLELHRSVEAEPHCRDCLNLREQVMPESWLTFNAKSMLGAALLGQQKYGEAEPFLLTGYEGMKQREKKIPAQGQIRLAEALNSLIELYSVLEKPEEVQKWQAELANYASENSFITLKVAALQAWFGLDTEFAATSERALSIAAETDDPEIAERTAKACSLWHSDDQARLASALKLARYAVEHGQESQFLSFFLMALGMAEYRNGNFDAANKALLAVEETHKKHPHLGCTSAFYRAMSLFRQGKQDEARELALSTIPNMKPLPADEKNPLANANHDDLIVWLAYKEAKALIGFEEPTATAEQVQK